MVVSGTCNYEVTFRHLLEAFEGEHFALQWFLWIQNHQRGRQTRSNRSQVSQAQACQIQREKTYPETLNPRPRLKCYLYHNFFFTLSILLSRFKQSKLYFPVYWTPFSSKPTFACVIWCSRPPNSERDITDTQSRYANRIWIAAAPSNLTHNRHRQKRKLYKCPNNSITNIAIFHTSSVGLRYSLVFTCFSFFISIELVTKRNRYICVSICLRFQMIDTGSLLMPISRPGLFTF